MSSTRVNEAKEVGAKSSRLMSDATYKVTHPRDGDGHPNLQESGGFSVMVTRAHMIVSRVDQSPSRSSNLGKGIEPNNGAPLPLSLGGELKRGSKQKKSFPLNRLSTFQNPFIKKSNKLSCLTPPPEFAPLTLPPPRLRGRFEKSKPTPSTKTSSKHSTVGL